MNVCRTDGCNRPARPLGRQCHSCQNKARRHRMTDAQREAHRARNQQWRDRNRAAGLTSDGHPPSPARALHDIDVVAVSLVLAGHRGLTLNLGEKRTVIAHTLHHPLVDVARMLGCTARNVSYHRAVLRATTDIQETAA